MALLMYEAAVTKNATQAIAKPATTIAKVITAVIKYDTAVVRLVVEIVKGDPAISFKYQSISVLLNSTTHLGGKLCYSRFKRVPTGWTQLQKEEIAVGEYRKKASC